ncbi:hypothetical protein EMIHUDRAFT_216526 [Emiliania huxleyi CCMP1516]|uniref:Uncharacterized protein n=2 Tax=Emiliania huxleyi TaxID=2903 RepID=A0A0D3ID65_EMIH1|nr:hypothetical protein EMIHUDRAFT_216526 [Emiliania huxleyi CCMP1516]EOD09200.1 hypothetical protein EMIHUDRAFT_216526 [Emiliania huxleyi CCMP1516]|eukprot:XP_005761629.1 hypothetical protein EMIHUDRAFT_216526 [Emiliania huxleyi CCMP1516]
MQGVRELLQSLDEAAAESDRRRHECYESEPDSATSPDALSNCRRRHERRRQHITASLERAASLFARREWWYKAVAAEGGRYYCLRRGAALQFVVGKRMVAERAGRPRATSRPVGLTPLL